MKKMLIVALIFLSGCAPFNLRKDMFGMNVQDVLTAKNTMVLAAPYDVKTTFDKVSAFLAGLDARISKSEPDNNFIVGYNFEKAFKCVNTSEVAFLIKPAAASGSSEVTVCSDNSFLADFIEAKWSEYIKVKA